MWELISPGGRKDGSELRILSSLEAKLTRFSTCIECSRKYASYKYRVLISEDAASGSSHDNNSVWSIYRP